MSKKKTINIHIDSELVTLARKSAFNQGFIYKGEGNFSAWVSDLIKKEIARGK